MSFQFNIKKEKGIVLFKIGNCTEELEPDDLVQLYTLTGKVLREISIDYNRFYRPTTKIDINATTELHSMIEGESNRMTSFASTSLTDPVKTKVHTIEQNHKTTTPKASLSIPTSYSHLNKIYKDTLSSSSNPIGNKHKKRLKIYCSHGVGDKSHHTRGTLPTHSKTVNTHSSHKKQSKSSIISSTEFPMEMLESINDEKSLMSVLGKKHHNNHKERGPRSQDSDLFVSQLVDTSDSKMISKKDTLDNRNKNLNNLEPVISCSKSSIKETQSDYTSDEDSDLGSQIDSNVESETGEYSEYSVSE